MPCEWVPDYGPCQPPTAWTSMTDEQRRPYEDAAADYLWRWTRQMFGVCEVVVKPCLVRPTSGSTFYGRETPRPWGLRSAYSGCAGSCVDPTAVLLPGPVVEVLSVSVGGVVLDPSKYAVEGDYISRTDGEFWPHSRPGSWSVTYRQGIEVPSGGRVAQAILAIELWKAHCAPSTCSLPKRISSISREGVTVGVALDNFEDIDKGHTGIWLIDSWVASVTKPSRPARAYSPDIGRW